LKQTVKRYTKGDFERFMITGKTPPGINNGVPNVTLHENGDNETNGYLIEKDVPIPEYYRMSEFPLLSLEVGDSFVTPLSKIKSLRNAITRIHKRNEAFKFITRTVQGHGRASRKTRVWRVATTS